jgi:hypothetical protein
VCACVWLLMQALSSRPTFADEASDRAACIGAYVGAQSARNSGHLIEAAQKLAACTHAECPGMIRRDCTGWLDEVDRAIPSVVLSIRDDQGEDVRVREGLIDGHVVSIDGRGLSLDPGSHAVEIRLADGAVHEERILVSEGEKERPVRIIVRSASRAAVRSRSPLAPLVLGGIAIVGLGVGSYFGVRGVADRSSLGCDVDCTSSNYASVNREFVAADVALGVGIVAAGAALALWLWPTKGALAQGASREPRH